MKRDDVFPSKYLKAADLGGKPLVVKIGSAPLETLKSSDGKEQQKIVLYFLGGTKKVLDNATNWDSVCASPATTPTTGRATRSNSTRNTARRKDRRLHPHPCTASCGSNTGTGITAGAAAGSGGGGSR